MSGTFPITPKPKSSDLISEEKTVVSIAVSGKKQSRIIGGHMWTIKLTFPQMLRATFAPIFAFVAGQRGQSESFQIALEQFNTPQGVATGTPLVDGVHAVGDNTILCDAFTASTTDIMKAGDIVKFASHTKVYMLTADSDSVALGATTLNIVPPLIEALADNEAVTVSSVQFTVSLDNSVQEWKTTNPNFSSYSVDLIESF